MISLSATCVNFLPLTLAAANPPTIGLATDVLVLLPPSDQATILENLSKEIHFIGKPRSDFLELLSENVVALRKGELKRPQSRLLGKLRDHDELLWDLIPRFQLARWPERRERAQRLMARLKGLRRSYLSWEQRRRSKGPKTSEKTTSFPIGMVRHIEEARDIMVFLGRCGSEMLELLWAFGDVTKELYLSADITQKAMARLAVAARRDYLTGLSTREALRQMVIGKIERRLERGKEVKDCWVLMADLDHFKRVNDTHGHNAGDTVLENVAHKLSRNQQLRRRDIVARWGGEEFLILLDDISLPKAEKLADRLRRVVEREPIYFDDIEGRRQKVNITISIGIAPFHFEHGEGELAHEVQTFLTKAIKQADAALYRAKKAGRNRVVYSWEK